MCIAPVFTPSLKCAVFTNFESSPKHFVRGGKPEDGTGPVPKRSVLNCNTDDCKSP
jgi:hypothetical protein